MKVLPPVTAFLPNAAQPSVATSPKRVSTRSHFVPSFDVQRTLQAKLALSLGAQPVPPDELPGHLLRLATRLRSQHESYHALREVGPPCDGDFAAAAPKIKQATEHVRMQAQQIAAFYAEMVRSCAFLPALLTQKRPRRGTMKAVGTLDRTLKAVLDTLQADLEILEVRAWQAKRLRRNVRVAGKRALPVEIPSPLQRNEDLVVSTDLELVLLKIHEKTLDHSAKTLLATLPGSAGEKIEQHRSRMARLQCVLRASWEFRL